MKPPDVGGHAACVDSLPSIRSGWPIAVGVASVVVHDVCIEEVCVAKWGVRPSAAGVLPFDFVRESKARSACTCEGDAVVDADIFNREFRSNMNARVGASDAFPLFLRSGGFSKVERMLDIAGDQCFVVLVAFFIGGRSDRALSGWAQEKHDS